MNQERGPGRRRFLKLLGGAAAALTLLGELPRRALAAALPHLTQENNKTAKELHYTEDATTAPAPHQSGQMCMNCNFYHGHTGETYAPCDLYPGFVVHSKGWCAGYAAATKQDMQRRMQGMMNGKGMMGGSAS